MSSRGAGIKGNLQGRNDTGRVRTGLEQSSCLLTCSHYFLCMDVIVFIKGGHFKRETCRMTDSHPPPPVPTAQKEIAVDTTVIDILVGL
ncbi:hypothetical protein MHYP_G00000710 [Metynnis hypsauchen]